MWSETLVEESAGQNRQARRTGFHSPQLVHRRPSTSRQCSDLESLYFDAAAWATTAASGISSVPALLDP